ncbi:hypothetical protein OAM67_00465 [bacterium]|nr:hypothetical protein [bacterium]
MSLSRPMLAAALVNALIANHCCIHLGALHKYPIHWLYGTVPLVGVCVGVLTTNPVFGSIEKTSVVIMKQRYIVAAGCANALAYNMLSISLCHKADEQNFATMYCLISLMSGIIGAISSDSIFKMCVGLGYNYYILWDRFL